MKLPTMYLVIVRYSSPSCVVAFEEVHSEYAEVLDMCSWYTRDDCEYRVFKMEFDVGDNTLETTTEITADVRLELESK